jgi:hypothetical protein
VALPVLETVANGVWRLATTRHTAFAEFGAGEAYHDQRVGIFDSFLEGLDKSVYMLENPLKHLAVGEASVERFRR